MAVFAIVALPHFSGGVMVALGWHNPLFQKKIYVGGQGCEQARHGFMLAADSPRVPRDIGDRVPGDTDLSCPISVSVGGVERAENRASGN